MGYKTNANALRLRMNRSWQSKGTSLRKESLSFLLSHSNLERYFEDFFNKRYFHRNGILFSHVVSGTKLRKKLRLTLFLFDPGYSIHRDYAFDFFMEFRLGSRWSRKNRNERNFFAKEYGIAYLLNRFNKLYQRKRRRLYRALERMFKRKIRKAFSFIRLSIRIIPLYKELLNAAFYAKFLMMKFMYRRHVVQIVKPIMKRLLNAFSGYRIDCSGRFTRRQRASFYKFSKGSVPFNTFNAQVQYHQVSFPLKYGACSMKVWLSNPILYGRTPYEVSNYYRNGLFVHRFPVRRPAYFGRSIGNLKGIGHMSPLKEFVSPYGKVLVKRLVPKEKYSVAYPFTAQFYNRRLGLLNDLLSFMKSRPSVHKRRVLIRHFLRPWKRRLSWLNEVLGDYRTFTRRELDEQTKKQLEKVVERAPVNLNYQQITKVFDSSVLSTFLKNVPFYEDSQVSASLSDDYFFFHRNSFSLPSQSFSLSDPASQLLDRVTVCSSAKRPKTRLPKKKKTSALVRFAKLYREKLVR